ncbi:hypothetical protein SO802_004624 [Lithocarpus litseifolius]|uniref:Uncharacterized protein n=1 Tax=Lithocarpus litseifolius TaxID=425828 RepID=A0AAW2E7E2_9ROSI
MCYQTKCSTCGKTTWGGCGRHVLSVYKGIPEGQHCLCRAWPGVKETSGLPDISWENLGFNPVTTDFMYVMKFSGDGEFLSGGLQRFGNIELNPASCVLNYGQGGLKQLNLVVKEDIHRAVPGGVGSVKAIGNYAIDRIISTPVLGGTILPGVTRKSIIEIAHSQGFQGASDWVVTSIFYVLLPVSYLMGHPSNEDYLIKNADVVKFGLNYEQGLEFCNT